MKLPPPHGVSLTHRRQRFRSVFLPLHRCHQRKKSLKNFGALPAPMFSRKEAWGGGFLGRLPVRNSADASTQLVITSGHAPFSNAPLKGGKHNSAFFCVSGLISVDADFLAFQVFLEAHMFVSCITLTFITMYTIMRILAT